MTRDFVSDIIRSAICQEGENTLDELLNWISEKNHSLEVQVEKVNFSKDDFWFYNNESGCIENKDKSFFSISGCKAGAIQQPIILQNEIGFLGILCKTIGNTLHFLMQAKVEPGNINKVQISPTIQATKSNFTQRHGGNRPLYLDYFINANQYEIIVDQIQSEQSSRFLCKRNRNIVVRIDEEDIDRSPNHCWMTLGQIKALLTYDNLVNMDTRTVLSCIPYSLQTGIIWDDYKSIFHDISFFNSVFYGDSLNHFPEIYHHINNLKMFHSVTPSLVPLASLDEWVLNEYGVECIKPHPFRVIYCNITIEGREVKHWRQPLFEALGKAVFGMFCRVNNDVMQFLVKSTSEIGCFDFVELGPCVQLENTQLTDGLNAIEQYFLKMWHQKRGLICDVVLSEEGGRFYHEENHNTIIHLQEPLPFEIPAGYFWLDYRTLNLLTQVNNCLNIQLRNLLSLLPF